jgi:hypothetical protein
MNASFRARTVLAVFVGGMVASPNFSVHVPRRSIDFENLLHLGEEAVQQAKVPARYF